MWHEICWEFQNEWNEEHLARRMTRNNLHFSPHRRQLSITCSTFPYYTKLFASSVNVDYEHFPVLSMRGLKTFFPGGLSDNRAKALYLKIASAYTTNALRHSKLSCASRTSELICIQSLSVANNTLPSTTVQKFRCYRQRFCWCNFFSLEDDSLINGSSCNLRWNFFKLISSKPERYFIERVFFLLLIPEREFHSQKPILDPVSQQNRKRRFKFIAGAVEVKRWYAMAQGANFYVLEQIYATTEDNRKVIQIIFEDTESSVVKEVSGKAFGNWNETSKQESSVTSTATEIMYTRNLWARKFCVCVATLSFWEKLNSYN